MNEQEIINAMKRVQGQADAPLHRSHLRRSLLTAPRVRGFAMLRTFVTSISMNKYYLSMGSLAAVVAIATVVAMSPIDPNIASAQEQVNRAFARAVAISPEMRAQLEAQMKSDMLKTLEEAKAAPDLKIMTKEEYEKDAQFSFGPAPTFAHTGAVGMGSVKAIAIKGGDPADVPEGGTFTVVNSSEDASGLSVAGEATHDVVFTATAAAPAGENVKMAGSFTTGTFMADNTEGGPMLSPVKYLSYTDPQGRKTVLGLDENDTPVFKFVTLTAGDIKQLDNGAIQIEGKQINMLQAAKAEVVGQ